VQVVKEKKTVASYHVFFVACYRLKKNFFRCLFVHKNCRALEQAEICKRRDSAPRRRMMRGARQF
jgi:hypothetical protein